MGPIRTAAAVLCALLSSAGTASARSHEQAVIAALKLSHSITGGYLPLSEPDSIFENMVLKLEKDDALGAATLAANSPYFANYLARRLALQMQNLVMDASGASDNDSTAFIIAHFVGGAGTKPSISTLWSENATYLVNRTHVASLSAAQLAKVNWLKDVSREEGQRIKDSASNTMVTLPVKHVGGYLTLSDRPGDRSFAMNTATAGTNLRMIVGLWETTTGLRILDAASTQARIQEVPRFVPQNDPNFFKGQGQPACISCHGGGMTSLSHGYSVFADVFNFDAARGFVYIAKPTTATMKSLGSDPNLRATIATCNLSAKPTPPCNPDGPTAFPNQKWDLKLVWEDTGILAKMGWKGATSGEGLNSLGVALGKAGIVYEFLAKRVANEVCPTGGLSDEILKGIAAKADPYANPPGTDDLRTIVAHVASHPECLGDGS